jgi:hypothetical protein
MIQQRASLTAAFVNAVTILKANIDIVRKCIAKPSVSTSTIDFTPGIQEMNVQFVYLPEAENGAARKVCDAEFDAMDLQLPGFKISGTVITFGTFRMHQESKSYYDQKVSTAIVFCLAEVQQFSVRRVRFRRMRCSYHHTIWWLSSSKPGC